MKASQFSDAQKAFIIKQGEDGTTVAEICRKAGIGQATHSKRKYSGMMPSEMRRLRELEQENARLRRSWRTCHSTRRCCRTLSNEKSEAWPEENAGRRDACRMGDLDPPCLCGDPGRPEDLPIQVPSARSGRFGTADQGDLPDPSALRLPARACPASAGGLGSEYQENDGHAAQEQDTETEGEGQTSRGSHRGRWTQ